MFHVHLCENRDYDIVSMADFLVETERAESRTEALRQLMWEGMLQLSQTQIKHMVEPELKKINFEPEAKFQFMKPEITANLTKYKSLIMENKELRGQLDMVAHELQRVNRMRLKKQLEEQAEEKRPEGIYNFANSLRS